MRRQPRAFTLLEAIFLCVIMSIVALGVGVGLQSAARVPDVTDNYLAIHARLVEKMEDLASLGFDALAANSGLSGNVTIANQTLPRTVTVANFDADANGSPDPDMIEVTVTIGAQSLKTRFTKP